MKTQTAGVSSPALVACGVLVAPVFYLIAAGQLAIRPDFDIKALPLSLLSLGELGWIQDLNFVVTGLLGVACAAGLRALLKGQRGGTWGAILVGLYGIGMIMAGMFGPDPMPSPSDTTGGVPQMSAEGAMHMVAFLLSFISLIAACFVFARRFFSLRQSWLGGYSAVTGVLTPVLIASSMTNPAFAGAIAAISGLVLFGWLSVVAWHIRTETPMSGLGSAAALRN